ncbi:MAG: hypothetical protein BGO04_08530 [Microbacterium sp. 70-38]|nr:MAG: hypothetical protein BGO04_08530 [Microbacterium sp. 70-38]
MDMSREDRHLPWLTPILWAAAVITYGGAFFFLLDFAFSHIANARNPGAAMDRAIAILFYPGLAILVVSVITASVVRIWEIRSRWIAAAAFVIIAALASVSISIAVGSVA